MSHLLILGGSGFFGKSILDSYRRGMLKQFDITEITVMARNADKLLTVAPNLLDDSVRLLNEDISTCNMLPHADFIIHAAASTDERNYITRPQVEGANIQAGTYNFCKLAPEFCKNSRVVYVSSGAVYGKQPSEMVALQETFSLGPIEKLSISKQNYAKAKRNAEMSIQQLGTEGLTVGIARCFAFIGSYLPLNQHFAIGNFIQDGLLGRPITVKAISPVYRSYMHADDLVCWLMTIAKNGSNRCPIYNVGSDEAISMGELADKIGDYFDVSVNKNEYSSMEIDRYIPSITKAKKELGLNIGINLESAITMVASELIKNAKL